ncbi:DUF6908 domain-containing protein [Niabella beijingensis]|uniref:DUF6908 domain-containing protein n=1 Tax=Niabella beijingensis TaxID=2872700 RepID=UPI001CBF7341|nr:hypothetical protein [Niabella beijingensis]MBZ4187660.1 hypothetical protein [Niabella beijingensis]
MVAINEKAQQILDHLIQQLGEKDYIRLQSETYASLSFERIGEFSSFYGPVKMYSLLRTSTVNSKMMYEPEICFYHFDDTKNDIDRGTYPYSFQLDLFGINQQSIELIDGAFHVQSIMQRQHTSYANNWLAVIKEQGFIK